MSFPLPLNATFHDVEWNRFNIDKVPHENVTCLGADRGDADAAIAHDNGGNTVPRRGRNQWVPRDLRVVVRMRINKTWRKYQSIGVDLLGCRFTVAFADCSNHAVFDRNITMKTRFSCAVTDPSILND